MKTTRARVRWLSFLAMACLCLNLSAVEKSADLAIVANKSLALESITKAELVKYLKVQRTKTPDGAKLVLVLPAEGTPERASILENLLFMSEAEIGRYYLQATFTGGIPAPPKTVPNGAAVLRFVAATPGGIGFVRASEVDGSVKVLRIDGKLPGDDGYPIPVK